LVVTVRAPIDLPVVTSGDWQRAAGVEMAFQDRSAQRAMREMEEQRRKNAQFLDMLDEVRG